MIIIDLSGGLGNQMFQFALYKKLISLGKDVYLDASSYSDMDSFRKLELLQYKGIKRSDLRLTNDYEQAPDFISRISFITKRWLLKRIGIRYEDKIGVFQPEVFDLNWAYLSGYWQNEKFFVDIREDILRTFSFEESDVDVVNKEYTKSMQEEQSVSLHVRRGDYLDPKCQKVYGGICTVKYYRNSVKYICEHVEKPSFYVFSDDLPWVRDNIDNLMGEVAKSCDIHYVDHNAGDKSFLDLYLMSQCKYHIIANSSFSWWGAWLGANEDKIVVAPSRWFANHDTSDVVCDDWVRMNRE